MHGKQEHTDRLPAPPCRDHIPGKIPERLCQVCTQLFISPGRHFGTTLLLCLLQSSSSDNRDALHHETGAVAAALAVPEVNGEHVKCIPVLNPPFISRDHVRVLLTFNLKRGSFQSCGDMEKHKAQHCLKSSQANINKSSA